MTAKFEPSDLREVFFMAKRKVPAFRFTATKEMSAALQKALAEKWLEPTTSSPWTFLLTESGEKELEKL